MRHCGSVEFPSPAAIYGRRENALERNMSENFKFIAAGLSADGKIQVFSIEPNGELQSRWKTSSDPNSSWTPWSNFQTPAAA
jgi:hypothetical protein